MKFKYRCPVCRVRVEAHVVAVDLPDAEGRLRNEMRCPEGHLFLVAADERPMSWAIWASQL